MKKYYRVIKENFLWEVGAILEDNDGCRPLNRTDVWDVTEYNGSEYISSRIVENCPEYFEKVYPSALSKAAYVTKEELKKQFNKATDKFRS